MNSESEAAHGRRCARDVAETGAGPRAHKLSDKQGRQGSQAAARGLMQLWQDAEHPLVRSRHAVQCMQQGATRERKRTALGAEQSITQMCAAAASKKHKHDETG